MKTLDIYFAGVDRAHMSRSLQQDVGVARAGRCAAVRSGSGFTLIEILIVVVILGILSAIVIPQFTDASQQANDASVRNQLQTLRGSIELFRQAELRDPDFIDQQWTEMISLDYLTAAPMNPLNAQFGIAAAPAGGVGWIWRDKGNGTFLIYATNEDATAEFVE